MLNTSFPVALCGDPQVMFRRDYGFAQITYFPGIAGELNELLSEVGTIEESRLHVDEDFLTVKLRLCAPAVVYKKGESPDQPGIPINSDTGALLRPKLLGVSISPIKSGSEYAVLSFALTFDSRTVKVADHTLEEMRRQFRLFADEAALGWRYL